jgi:hypothetical protein
VQRVAPIPLLVAALVADAVGGHGLAFYLLLGAIVVTAHAALDAYGILVDLAGSPPELPVARFRTALAVVALALAIVAAVVRAPALTEATVPAVGVSAAVAALALLVVQGALRVAR